MKKTNYILKVMENLQTNVSLLNSFQSELNRVFNDDEYTRLSDSMANKKLARPNLAIDSFMHYFEETYDYLEQLLLTIDKPF